jgi:hypothetical protein
VSSAAIRTRAAECVRQYDQPLRKPANWCAISPPAAS